MTFYLTIGFTWAFFCLVQSALRHGYDPNRFWLSVLSYLVAMLLNLLLWPVSMVLTLRRIQDRKRGR